MAQKQHDFKKDWDKIKERLIAMSQEAKVLAKKGEKELIKFSHKSKLHIDATSLTLKKEKLFYHIGKEYVRAKNSGKTSQKMSDMLEELSQVEKQERSLKRKIKAAGVKKT